MTEEELYALAVLTQAEVIACSVRALSGQSPIDANLDGIILSLPSLRTLRAELQRRGIDVGMQP